MQICPAPIFPTCTPSSRRWDKATIGEVAIQKSMIFLRSGMVSRTFCDLIKFIKLFLIEAGSYREWLRYDQFNRASRRCRQRIKHGRMS